MSELYMNEQHMNNQHIELYCATSVTATVAAYGVTLMLCGSDGVPVGRKSYSGIVGGLTHDGKEKPLFWAEIIAATEGLKKITDKTLPVKVFVSGILPHDRSWFVDVVGNRRLTDEYSCDEPWYYFFTEWERFKHHPSAHIVDVTNEYYQQALTAALSMTKAI